MLKFVDEGSSESGFVDTPQLTGEVIKTDADISDPSEGFTLSKMKATEVDPILDAAAEIVNSETFINLPPKIQKIVSRIAKGDTIHVEDINQLEKEYNSNFISFWNITHIQSSTSIFYCKSS